MNFVPEIRLAEPRDHVHLCSMDVKCFDHYWAPDVWDRSRPFVQVACFYGTPIALLACEVRQFRGRVGVLVRKLCVRKLFRQRGLSRLLLARAYDMQTTTQAQTLSIAVPESLTVPSNPANCVGWLTHMGFKAEGILPEKIPAYGETEDLFLFTFTLSKET